MLFKATLAATLLLATSALADTPLGKAQGAPTAASPSYQLLLSSQEIQVLRRALDLAAGTCSTQADGCTIGLMRQTLTTKFDTAPTVSTETPKKQQ